jgi:glycosyltransferase involved in cell wall biosynthesis
MISVVTITYNNYNDLKRTIDSLTRQDVEHIVINGGTCISTNSFLESEFKGLYISEPDDGIADAFTKGVRLSSFKHVCFINSGDVLVDEEYFCNVSSYIHKDFDIICCDNLHEISGVGIVYKTCAMKLPNMPYNHQGLIVKKELIEKTNFFDKSFQIAMDYDSIIKISQLCKKPKIHYYKKPVILMDGSGVSHSRNYLGEYEKFLSLRKNGMLTFKFSFQLTFQYVKAQTKRFLICIGLAKVVILYKRIINKQV